ncbi:MAG: 2-amino-4-hydroxy-6-hydroxymethyldihydropteridine diphosphokinase, partial [Burkholderiales bacterium]|nr:2-amino-4-hydroxy-6-hydroxymethyldihydropteridine diphosphokinase [Burkholderiales bacterium]
LRGLVTVLQSQKLRLEEQAQKARDGDDYVNAVAALDTSHSALALLAQLQAIELRHGRERSYLNAPRTLDLDLLLFDEETIALPQLQVPHPRMLERAFVLQPLLDISPEICIPGSGPAQRFLPAVADQGITPLAL